MWLLCLRLVFVKINQTHEILNFIINWISIKFTIIAQMKKIFLIIDIVIADILTKYWVNMSDPEFSVIGNILKITHVKNTGVAFGTPLPGISFVIPLILLGISIFLWNSWKTLSQREKTGYLMILT